MAQENIIQLTEPEFNSQVRYHSIITASGVAAGLGVAIYIDGRKEGSDQIKSVARILFVVSVLILIISLFFRPKFKIEDKYKNT